MSYDAKAKGKCSSCGREYTIGLNQHIMPYNDVERGTCLCGNQVTYKSRYVEVDFIFHDDKERS